MNITFVVAGQPTPQGSKSAFMNQRTGRPVIVDAGTTAHKRNHRAWRKAVKEAAEAWLLDHPTEPLDEPLSVTISFWFPLPAGDKYRTRHAVKPDLDKLVRSVLDSLTDSKLITDDSRICTLHLRKRYHPTWEGIEVDITPMGEREREDREQAKELAKLQRRGTPKTLQG